MKTESNVWKTLSAIDVSKHVEKKGNLSYLSWTWAWATLMDHYPSATYVFSEPLTLPNGTVEVQVTVTVEGVARTMWMPVMDNRHNSTVDPTTRDISDARMRCLVKAISMHGLGSYIFAGESLPDVLANSTISAEQAAIIKKLLEETQSNVSKFCQVFKCESVDDMQYIHYERAIGALKSKVKK